MASEQNYKMNNDFIQWIQAVVKMST